MNMQKNIKKMESDKLQKNFNLYGYNIEKEIKKEFRIKQKRTSNIVLFVLESLLVSSVLLLSFYGAKGYPSTSFFSLEIIGIMCVILLPILAMIQLYQEIIEAYYGKITKKHVFLRIFLNRVFCDVLESSFLNPKSYRQQEKNK